MRDQYKRDGYYLVKNFFTRYRVACLCDDILEVFRLQANYLGIESDGDQMVYDLAARDWDAYHKCALAAHQVPLLHEMGASEKLTDTASMLGLEVPSISMKPVLFISSHKLATNKFYWKAEAHQDFSGMKGSLDGLVAWAPIVPMTEDMGYLEVLPGSHKRGYLEHKQAGPGFVAEAGDEGWVPIKMDVGDVLFFSAFTLHRSGSNVSDKIRWAVNWRFDNLAEPSYIARRFVKPFNYERAKVELPDGFPDQKDIEELFKERS